MALVQKRLGGPSTLTTTTTTDIYTVPAATTTIVKQIILSNYSGSTATATISLLPTGDSIGNQHLVFNQLSLSSNETVTISTSLVMNASDKIKAGASANSSINIILNGVEES